MRDNKVFLNDEGVLEIIVNGDQTVASVQAMGDEVIRLGAEERRAGKPVLVLDNLFQMGKVPDDARRRVAEIAKAADFDKLAFAGSGGILRLGANLILQATGKSGKVKYFDDYQKAILWLKLG